MTLYWRSPLEIGSINRSYGTRRSKLLIYAPDFACLRTSLYSIRLAMPDLDAKNGLIK